MHRLEAVRERSDFFDDQSESPSLATLAGDPGRIAVERAIAELRSGRPVIVVSPDAPLLLLAAVETADSSSVGFFRSSDSASLVLSPPRLRYLGVLTDVPLAYPVKGWSEERILAAALDQRTRLPANTCEVNPSSQPGLELLKRAQLLPAALVMTLSAGNEAAGLQSVDVADILGYHDRIAETLQISARSRVPLIDSTETEFVVFRGSDGLKDQVAIVIGKPDTSQPVPVRLHSACLTGDLFGSLKCDCGEQLRLAIKKIAELGGGVLLYLDQEGRGIGLRSKIRTYRLQEDGHDTVDSDAILGYGADERRYRIAGRMLALLGYDRIVMLTNNPDKTSGLIDAGMNVVSTQSLLGTVNTHNRKYLATKAARAGHALDQLQLGGVF